MLNGYFMSFNGLSDTEILDVDMLAFTSTFIVLREQNCIIVIVENLERPCNRINNLDRPLLTFLNHNACVMAS